MDGGSRWSYCGGDGDERWQLLQFFFSPVQRHKSLFFFLLFFCFFFICFSVFSLSLLLFLLPKHHPLCFSWPSLLFVCPLCLCFVPPPRFSKNCSTSSQIIPLFFIPCFLLSIVSPRENVLLKTEPPSIFFSFISSLLLFLLLKPSISRLLYQNSTPSLCNPLEMSLNYGFFPFFPPSSLSLFLLKFSL